MAVKLNLACGSDYKPGWVNIDVAAWPGYRPPDVLWDARNGNIPFEDGTVDEIYAGYLLLHILPRFRPAILSESLRVLKPGGRAVFGEVDMEKVMKRWLRDPFDKSANELIWGELGSIHGTQLEEFDRHTHGYCEGTLRRELMQAGFVEVKRINVHVAEVWYELTLEAKKGTP